MTTASPVALTLIIAGAVLFCVWTYYATKVAAEARPRTWPAVLVFVGMPALTAYATYRFAADLGDRAGTVALAALAITVGAAVRRGSSARERRQAQRTGGRP